MYWTSSDDMAVIDRVKMKGRVVIIPDILKKQALGQVNINHMGIEKPKSWHTNL